MQNSSLVARYKPVKGPTEAFSCGSWKNPKQEGPLGKIRWGGLATESIMAHAGAKSGSNASGVITPAITSSTSPAATCDELAARFADPIVFGRLGKIYSRLGNETVFELECALAGLHGCGDAMAFGSGMAAVSSLFSTLVNVGDNIVSHKNIYGCSDDLLRVDYPARRGVETRFVDFRDPKALKQAIDSKTRAVFFETPSNPSLDIIEIAKVAEIVKGRCPVIVDNTFASPMGQNPFDYGANIVVYSLTKSIGGHANAIGGAVLGSGAFLAHLFSTRKNEGGIMTGGEAATFLNGIKTLSIRYSQMEKNAVKVAEMLNQHSEVRQVFYPLYAKGYPFNGQMKGPGYMIAFELKNGLDGGKMLIDSLNLATNAVSLGGVETLICHPASTTHACVPQEARIQKGITDGLIRISVGIEAIADILGDLGQALGKVAKLNA
ncbi:MAG: aminotransferase class I/II-fold pyridoxal phosphate-dependent enzyme [Candidatus Micrarchaeota archaeon]|nr:aminotransferase class I/II-fold pyridoxal phosphate-dependent enzyme [Candidatus Micrarchaeota archaeon]